MSARADLSDWTSIILSAFSMKDLHVLVMLCCSQCGLLLANESITISLHTPSFFTYLWRSMAKFSKCHCDPDSSREWQSPFEKSAKGDRRVTPTTVGVPRDDTTGKKAKGKIYNPF